VFERFHSLASMDVIEKGVQVYSARSSLAGVHSRLNGLHMIQRPASGTLDLELGIFINR
jgi:hypothetical protein